jgi:HAD superfamily hydrolase (TIGR01549 family)
LNNQNIFLEVADKKIDVLLFDIFDTIILRKVHPEYVKKIFSKKLKEYYNLDISSEKLYKYRFDIEASLCRENEKNGFDLEFLFDEFAKTLFEQLNKNAILDKEIGFDKFLLICKKLEIDSEIATQVVDHDVIELARSMKKKDIKLYCLSDFYLSREMLTKLFVEHGINDIFDDIFVSSEYLLTKRSGKLYDKVLDMHFRDKKVAMIGDNHHSDFEMAKEKGLQAFWLDRKSQYQHYENHKIKTDKKMHMYDKVEEIVSKHASHDRGNNIYFQEISYTLYYFTYLLAQQLHTSGVKHVLFLSREGEFLKKIFDHYVKIHNIKEIESHYFLVSRKSTFIASLDSLENETFHTLFRQYRAISITSFLKSLNFNKTEISSINKDAMFDIETVEVDLPTSNAFKSLLKMDSFKYLYETKRVEQKNNLITYINSFGANIEENGLYIVDAGWKGTMQDHLFALFEEKVKIRGFYIGLVTDLVEHHDSQKHGLVFDYQSPDIYDKIFLENISLFEVMLGASHGSADSYVYENSKIRVVTYQEKEEKEIYDNVISKIQNSLFLIICDLVDEFKLSHMSLLDMKRDVAKMHARIIYAPTKEEVQFFRQLYHYENFGLFQFSEFNQHETKGFLKNTKNIMKFLKNPKEFLKLTFWKAAAMDDLGLLSVYYIYAKYKQLKIFKGLK